MTARALMLLTLLTGCASLPPVSPVVTPGTNFTTFEHPFTDEAAEAIRQQAVKICAQQKKKAVKTQSVCSLTKCSTTYQCEE